ncbi:MAG: GYD domain-containing protein [Candidatus Acidiferrales bacterium]
MPHYLVQVGYTSDAFSALVKNPVNRMEQVRPAIERLGGKIISGFMSFGDYDTLMIIELPSNTDAAAIAIAAAAGGSVRAIKTTPLLTAEEAMEALKKAQGTGYRAVGAGA